MAKSSYKIPASIDRSHLDHEIVIEFWDIKLKPVTIKVLLYWFAVLGVLVWTVLQSPLSHAGIGWRLLFALWFIPLAIYFGRQLRTGEFVWSQMPSLVSYITPGSRDLPTRRSSEPYGLMEMLNIKDIEPSGLIHFLDGSVGQAYQVVGNASKLLFDQDRMMIIDRVDNFWRKVDTSSEWIFFDTKEPQRVTSQIAALYRRNENLKKRGLSHPELFELAEEQYDILAEDVGDKFNSVHQYLIIKSPKINDLRSAHELLNAEITNSTLMFRRCMRLDDEGTYRAFGPIFGAQSTRTVDELEE